VAPKGASPGTGLDSWPPTLPWSPVHLVERWSVGGGFNAVNLRGPLGFAVSPSSRPIVARSQAPSAPSIFCSVPVRYKELIVCAPGDDGKWVHGTCSVRALLETNGIRRHSSHGSRSLELKFMQVEESSC
jgi:hypothetical protein